MQVNRLHLGRFPAQRRRVRVPSRQRVFPRHVPQLGGGRGGNFEEAAASEDGLLEEAEGDRREEEERNKEEKEPEQSENFIFENLILMVI